MVAKIAATTAALVGITACGASRASHPPPEPGSGGDIAQDAYLASIHRDVWFDGSDTSTLLRIGTAVCAGLDHDSPVHDIVGMAAANHIPPKQVRGLMRAATKICPQHQAAVEAYYTRTPGVTRHLDATRSPSGRGVAQVSGGGFGVDPLGQGRHRFAERVGRHPGQAGVRADAA